MNEDKLIIETLINYLPRIKDWINNLLIRHSSISRSVSELGFSKLPSYYSKEILDSAKVVSINNVPAIPLTSFGLPQFGEFERMSISGVTFLDTYFVRSDFINLESLHFHELVHIIQWEHLGIDKFLLTYGLGLTKYGYKNSPLEMMANRLKRDFEENKPIADIKNIIIAEIDKLITNLF